MCVKTAKWFGIVLWFIFVLPIFCKVRGKLKATEGALKTQKASVAALISEVMTDVRYTDGIEEVEATFTSFMEGKILILLS
jgi:hypothetical protein